MTASPWWPRIRQAAGFTKVTVPSASRPKIPSVTEPRISRPRSSETASWAVRSSTMRSRLPESWASFCREREKTRAVAPRSSTVSPPSTRIARRA